MAPALVSAAVLLLALGIAVTPANAQFTVTTANDDGAGSLREAIQNANNNFGPDQIQFAIPGAGPHVIELQSALPTIFESVVIDGYTQPGSSVNNQQLGSNANIQVTLDGSMVPAGNGLVIGGIGSTVKGLSFVGWRTDGALLLTGGGGHKVVGNFFGIKPDGSWGSDTWNRTGVWIGAEDCVVGTPALADRNVIGNNSAEGIFAASSRAFIQNNAIGTDDTGIAPAGNGVGIRCDGSDIQIGGVGPLEGNVIAFSRQKGVGVVFFNSEQIRIRGNSFFKNGGLGIDLGAVGVDDNDPAPDADTGANNLQNYPVLVSATDAGGTRVTGSLESAPNTTFDIDFYSNAISDNGPADGAGNFHGEGQSYLGSAQVTTNGNGQAVIDTTVFGVFVGPWISATATDPEGNTSEFSATVAVAGDTFTVTNINQSGLGSFDEKLGLAAGNGNNDSAVDRIFFDTSAGGVIDWNPVGHTFSPNTVFDFYTQPGSQPSSPGTGPCNTDGVRSIGIDSGFFTIEPESGNSATGLDLRGTLEIPAGVEGVRIVDSVIETFLGGTAMFVAGNFNSIENTELHGNGDVPAVSISGSSNWFSRECFDGALQGVSIGSFPPVQANSNTIADSVVPSSSQIAINVVSGFGNTFSRNTYGGIDPSPFGQVAIDLRGDGNTANDFLDLDEGPNDLQNFPVIGAAWGSEPPGGGSTTVVRGVMDSEPNQTYTLEFFANADCSADDYGPPGRYLDSIEVATNSTGLAAFVASVLAPTVPGEVIVASATGPFGSTSELSACSTVAADPPTDIFIDGFESGDTSSWSGSAP